MLARRVDFDGAISPATIRSLRERIEILEEENRQLREAARPLTTFPAAWKLTRTEAQLLTALMRSRTGAVSDEALLTAVYGLEPDVDVAIIKVFVCKLRKKLSTAGVAVEIRTVWGQGYKLSPGAVAILRAELTAEPGEAARLRELEATAELLTETAARREADILDLQRALWGARAENDRLRASAPAPAAALAAAPPKEKAWKRWAGPPKRGGGRQTQTPRRSPRQGVRRSAMIVFKGVNRPRLRPSYHDPFEGPLRAALGQAKRRRAPVTLPAVRLAAPPPDDERGA